MMVSETSLRSNDEQSGPTKTQYFPNIPDGKFNKVFFFTFYPTIYLLWLVMPDIKLKPDFSKILLSSFQIIIFSLGFCYLIYKVEYMLIIAFSLKVHFVGFINGILFSAR